MRRVLTGNLRQGCLCLRFILGILLFVCSVILSQMDQFVEIVRTGNTQAYGYSLFFLNNGLSGDALSFTLPLICALPYASGFADDIKSGVIKFILTRCKREEYLWGKILGCALCGGLLVLLGTLCSGLVSAGMLSFYEQAPAEGENLKLILEETVIKTFLLALSGGLWAAVGMLFSCFTGSKYVSYLSPFISYYLMIVLYERYFPTMIILYPISWLNADSVFPFGVFGTAVWVMELFLFVALIFVGVGGRKLKSV